MAKQTISYNDNAATTANKLNDNFSELYNGQGGGGGSTPTGIIARNQEAIHRIAAAKKHFDTTVNNKDVWPTNNGENLFCIAHCSDLHCDATRYANFRDFVDGVSLIDIAINTGDMVSSGSTTDWESGIVDVEFENAPLMVLGNHEIYGSQFGQTKAQVCELLGMDDPYYSVNYSTPKIKVIVLDEYDMATLSKANAAKSGWFRSTQIAWFISELKSAKTNGYSVIICRHSPECKSADNNKVGCLPTANDKGFSQRNYQWGKNLAFSNSDTIIEDIVAAFRAGSTISKTYTFADNSSVTVNETFSGAGSFICYIVGHMHIDMTGYSHYHSDQLYLLCPTSACIGLTQSGTNENYGTEVSDLPRIAGTKCEDCFNVYGIDTVNKVVKVVRVGADMNDLMEPREVAYFEYEPSQS